MNLEQAMAAKKYVNTNFYQMISILLAPLQPQHPAKKSWVLDKRYQSISVGSEKFIR